MPSDMSRMIWMMMILLLAAASLQAATGEEAPPITIDPRCLAECGNVSIPYPFGAGHGCFLPGLEVFCNHTFSPPRLFLADSVSDGRQYFRKGTYKTDDGNYTTNWGDPRDSTQMEVMDISASRAEVRLYAAMSSDCLTRQPYHSFTQVTTVVSDKGPFLISASRNVLIGVGLNVEVVLSTSMSGSFGGSLAQCTSQPDGAAKDGPCRAQGCCEAHFDATRRFNQLAVFADNKRTGWFSGRVGKATCSFGMLVEKGWYNYSSEDVYGGEETYFSKKFPKGVPQVLEFVIGNSTCPAQDQPPPQGQGYACLSGNSSCVDASNRTGGYVCKCLEHYDGNPYIPGAGGCQDIDECQLRERHSELRTQYPCSNGGICKNRLLGYDCPCKPGMKGDGKTGVCTEKFPRPAKVAVGKLACTRIELTSAAPLLLFVFHIES